MREFNAFRRQRLHSNALYRLQFAFFNESFNNITSVAQDMAKESTLNTADIPLVARSIQTAVDNYLRTHSQKLASIQGKRYASFLLENLTS